MGGASGRESGILPGTDTLGWSELLAESMPLIAFSSLVCSDCVLDSLSMRFEADPRPGSVQCSPKGSPKGAVTLRMSVIRMAGSSG
jgi:hypothetical protein